MKVLVKVGGTLLDEEDSRKRLARELTEAARIHQLVVVHGGGKQMTRFLAERGVESRFIDGLRVTTPDVLDAVLKVFAGSVNHEFVAAFAEAGGRAVGLSGVDACLTEAAQMREDLGAVGKIIRANAALLDLLVKYDYIPVVACVAGDTHGRIYNVNADQMASACAVGFGAEKLVFLTDVDGVRGISTKVLSNLSPAACNSLIQEGIASGGMQAKLTAACEALSQGVKEIVIAPGSLCGVLQQLLEGGRIGTRLALEEIA